MIRKAFTLLFIPFAGPVLAEGFLLASPIDCDLSSTACYIQQYMDHDPGPGVQDFTCAKLSYDGHKGTDFAVPTLRAMHQGVNVLAAAPGVVIGLRDGMEDAGYSAQNAAEIEGKECGNGLVLRHEDGWKTQYCHLKRGSLAVQKGDRVSTGRILGQVGQSGRAAFPHLHLSVRKDGEKIDPFHPNDTLSCATEGGETLWAEPIPYQAGGIIDVGLSDRLPDYAEVKAGKATAQLQGGSDAVVFYSFNFGTQTGDRLTLALSGPNGPIAQDEIVFEKHQAQNFRAIGRKRSRADWPAGTYVGTAQLMRDGVVISERRTSAHIP